MKSKALQTRRLSTTRFFVTTRFVSRVLLVAVAARSYVGNILIGTWHGHMARAYGNGEFEGNHSRAELAFSPSSEK